MNSKYIYSILFLCFGIFIFSACQKENIDTTTLIEDEIETEVILCDLVVIIQETPTGSGNLLAIVQDANTQSFTYVWSTGEETPGITATADGTYTVTVTDPDGCTGEATYTVTLDLCLGFGVAIDEDPQGTLNSTVSAGTEPFVYEWSTGETTPSIDVTVGGTYSLLVTDALGCTTESEITIGDPAPCNGLTVEIHPDQIGQYLIAFTAGGTIPLSFEWSTGELTSSILIPGAGIYSVTVTDADGCTATDSYEVN